MVHHLALERIVVISLSPEGREVKAATLDRDFRKLMTSTPFGVCDGEGGQEEERGESCLMQVCSPAENVSRQPDLERGERTVLFCF